MTNPQYSLRSNTIEACHFSLPSYQPRPANATRTASLLRTSLKASFQFLRRAVSNNRNQRIVQNLIHRCNEVCEGDRFRCFLILDRKTA